MAVKTKQVKTETLAEWMLRTKKEPKKLKITDNNGLPNWAWIIKGDVKLKTT